MVCKELKNKMSSAYYVAIINYSVKYRFNYLLLWLQYDYKDVDINYFKKKNQHRVRITRSTS